MKRKLVVFVAVCLGLPMIMGSSCNLRSAMNEVRRVHVNVREAFQMMDRVVAPLIDEAADRCIAEVRERGLEGAEGQAAAFECIRPYFQLEEVVSSSRELLGELENVYTAIEAGSDRVSDWQYWARQLVAHGRSIVRICVELHVDIPSGFVTALDTLCELTQCQNLTPPSNEVVAGQE